MSDCVTCVLSERRKSPDVPLWDSIFPAEYFDVTHAFSTSLPGWIVLVAKRHIESVDQLTEEESLELGTLVRQVSMALKHAVGCEKTYVMQFAEMKGHGHVHFHVVPRMANLPEEHKGPGIFHYLNVGEADEISESDRNEVATKMLEAMS